MATLDGSNREALEAWLQDREPAVSIVVAARAALRVLPFLRKSDGRGRHDIAGDVVLSVFRATAVAWAAAKYPDRATAISRAAVPAVLAVPDAAYAASAAAYAAYAAAHGAAATDAVVAAVAADAGMTIGTGDDTAAIVHGRTAKQVANRKLWPSQHPKIDRLWSDLKADLLAQPEDHFEVWTDWYEARLAGRAANEKLEIARVMIDDHLWRQGPTVLNAEIKRLILEHTPLDPKAATSGLAQRPAAFAFRVADNKIDAAPEDATPLDPATSNDLHHETKRKAAALRDRFLQIQADPQLRANVDRLIARLGDNTVGLRPGLILSALRALQADVRAWDNEEGRKELSSADLSRLVDLAETTRDLASSFPKAREIEAEAVSLDLPERIDAIEAHVVEIVGVMDTSDGATKLAKDAIHETVAAIPEARTEADRRKQLAYSLLDIGNFARAGLSFVKASSGRLIAPVGKGARVAGYELRGLGKDSWKGIRKGLPKGVESGARKIGHAMIVGGATALMAHIAGPLAALGTLVSSFAPLGKIAKELSDADDADDTPDEPEDR